MVYFPLGVVHVYCGGFSSSNLYIYANSLQITLGCPCLVDTYKSNFKVLSWWMVSIAPVTNVGVEISDSHDKCRCHVVSYESYLDN